MRNNFPGLLKPLSANEKRKFFKSESITRPPGVALADIHAAGIQADAAIELFEVRIGKLLKALHWKHTGKIVRWNEGVKATWYTNAQFGIFSQSEERKFYGDLPACPPIVRNKRDLSDQFAYRCGRNYEGDITAFLIVFRGSFLITGIVAQSQELLAEIRTREADSD